MRLAFRAHGGPHHLLNVLVEVGEDGTLDVMGKRFYPGIQLYVPDLQRRTLTWRLPEVRCPECGGGMDLKQPSRNKWFWGCLSWPECDGLHPAGPDGLPRGGPISKAVRRARNEAHKAFDPLWRSGSMRRTDAYLWLAKQLRISRAACHMGLFDEAMCEKVVRVCENEGWAFDQL